MDFEQAEQTRRLVVVTALEALSKIYMNKDLLPKIAECEKELRKYAFPEDIDLEGHVFLMEEPCFCGDDDCQGGCDDL